ncbi:hypothetical protein KRX52_11825 [Pseudomonas sp. MAP12]|uniref:YqjK-like protein n=1 Tax=Geopseudomonas aromaticivorans TaxID=2849492 RepID=A0ABS6MXD8_9GAMM|nr:hypothetical protein [Pseudomonas aromaticivorans]MBV2133478.1 hypothetical protein [Pseudomonas aromaticivorans]
MTPPRLSEHASPQQLRKELVRMRMQLHRQELHYESLRLTQPLQQVRAWQQRLNLRHAPLWGLAGVTLLGFVGGKGAGSLKRWLRLAGPYVPLAVAALRLLGMPRARSATGQDPQQP